MNVTNIASRRKEPRDPHFQGPALCLACRHEWHAVAPIGLHQFECPACGTLRGVWKLPVGVSPGTKVFTCMVEGCDSQHMHVIRTAEGLWRVDCVRCGYEHALDTVFPLLPS